MIRNTTNGDISDDEFETVLKPFLDDYDNFIYSYVMPEIIAYYIANAFNRNYIKIKEETEKIVDNVSNELDKKDEK